VRGSQGSRFDALSITIATAAAPLSTANAPRSSRAARLVPGALATFCFQISSPNNALRSRERQPRAHAVEPVGATSGTDFAVMQNG
jgi:hypothetical protein